MYIEFEKWLSKLLENDMPDNTAAYNFNIYEEEDETYGVQLIASDEFSEDDDDWACSEIWSSEEEIFYIDHSDEKDADRERGLEFISQLISDYLEKGEKADKLKAVKAVGAGFVDGDLKILYKEA
ncbi:MAG: hypothetical protein IJN05_12185 [Ruminococcus sp.]|nr:hypothetical protein [Ruminococcus sp.]MBQ7009951.1 hypothetical protein [Ruminococcus sp.]